MTQEISVNKLANSRKREYPNVTEFALGLAPVYHGSGIRRRYEEIENPLNWDREL